MRTAICIVAHEGDQELFDRHLNLWTNHEGSGPLFVVCPWGREVKTDLPVLTYPSEDGGKNHVRRWRQMLKRLRTVEVERFVLFEPDSFCLSSRIPEFYVIGPTRVKAFDAPMIVGNLKHGIPAHAAVSSPYYMLHPMIITKGAIEQLADAFLSVPDDFEGGHSDRAICLLASQCGIRVGDFHRYGLGYAQIRVFASEYPALTAAVAKGAAMIHGIKEEALLERVLKLAEPVWPATLPLVDDMSACWIPGAHSGYLLKDLDEDFRRWFAARADLHERYPELVWGLRQL